MERPPERPADLLLPEGEAVGTLVLGGVALMGADFDAVKRAVIAGIAVMSAFANGTFDTCVAFGIHNQYSFNNINLHLYNYTHNLEKYLS